jgi:hypothetical protein
MKLLQKTLITSFIVIASMNLTACAKDETAPKTTEAKPETTEAQPALEAPSAPVVKIPATTPANGAKDAPTKKSSVDPAALLILDRLEKAGEKYTTVQSDVVMHIRSPLTGDITERTGSVAYQKGTKDKKEPSKFRISFETLQQDEGPRMKEKIDYIFDGQYLTEDNYKLKTRTRYQLAAKNEKIEPLKIGQGPFPMPFGQKTADILEYLTPVTRKPNKKDPKNTDYIKLLPNEKNKDRVNFVRLEMWVDKTTNLPVKIVSKTKNKDVRTVTLTNTRTTVKIDPRLFNVKKPSGFKLHIERMK